MFILLIGMSHKTAPVEVRERMAQAPDHMEMVLSLIRESNHIKEGVCFSTCNRFEVVAVSENLENGREAILDLMSSLSGMDRGEIVPYTYEKVGEDAIKHLFMVASSLDSMVIGEPQILGQIKDAYRAAVDRNTTGVILNRLMHRAFHTAKRVRSETGISESAVSVSYAAVELARKIFQELAGKTALLVGAGEMGELAAKHLLKSGVSRLGIVNRSLSKAVELAVPMRATAHSLDELEDLLWQADIVIVSTGAQHYVITYEMMKSTGKKRVDKPLFLIDISVPRNVDPRVTKIDNIYLYDIDDLKGVVEFNLNQRQAEAKRAQGIIEEEVFKYLKWLETLEVVPTIVSLQKKAEEIIQNELRKSRSLIQRLTEPEREQLETLVRSVAEKLINDPILFLKGKSGKKNLQLYVDMAQKLFNLNEQWHRQERE